MADSLSETLRNSGQWLAVIVQEQDGHRGGAGLAAHKSPAGKVPESAHNKLDTKHLKDARNPSKESKQQHLVVAVEIADCCPPPNGARHARCCHGHNHRMKAIADAGAGLFGARGQQPVGGEIAVDVSKHADRLGHHGDNKGNQHPKAVEVQLASILELKDWSAPINGLRHMRQLFDI